MVEALVILGCGQLQNRVVRYAGLDQRPARQFGSAAAPHDLILESRTRLTITGVQKVLHCSAESAAIETGKGTLHLAGAQLNMTELDLEAGQAKFTGRIDGLEYTSGAPAGGFWHRLLR